MSEMDDFLKYIKTQRNDFVKGFWSVCGSDKEARVLAEDLLIAYDQMYQRLSEGKSQPDTASECNKQNVSNNEAFSEVELSCPKCKSTSIHSANVEIYHDCNNCGHDWTT